LEDLPGNAQPVVIVRAARPQDLVLAREIREFTRLKRGCYYEFVGHREEASVDAHALHRLVPDLRRRDIFVCGPEGFVAGIANIARLLGVPDEAIHHEAFAL
jgi:ferredoxin-NADP reductase